MSGDEPLNSQDAGSAGDGLSERGELAAMKESFAEIASARAMFGNVPNGERAAAALESAAMSLLNELEASGTTVRDIQNDAWDVANLADEADGEANAAVLRGYQENMAHLGSELERRNPSRPQGVEFQ